MADSESPDAPMDVDKENDPPAANEEVTIGNKRKLTDAQLDVLQHARNTRALKVRVRDEVMLKIFTSVSQLLEHAQSQTDQVAKLEKDLHGLFAKLLESVDRQTEAFQDFEGKVPVTQVVARVVAVEDNDQKDVKAVYQDNEYARLSSDDVTKRSVIINN